MPKKQQANGPGPVSSWHRDADGNLLPGYTYTRFGVGGVPMMTFRPPESKLTECPDCGALMTRDRARCRVCKSKIHEELRIDVLKELKRRERGG